MFAVHNKQPMEFLDSSAPLYGRARRWWGSVLNEHGNLSRLSSRLPFTKDYTVVPVLFLKNEPTDNSANVMLPQDVIGLLE